MLHLENPTPRIRNVINKLRLGLPFQPLHMRHKPRILHIHNRSPRLLTHRPTLFQRNHRWNIQSFPHRRLHPLVRINGTNLEIKHDDGSRDVRNGTHLRKVDGVQESDLAIALATHDKVWDGADVAEGEDGGHGGDGPVRAIFLGGEVIGLGGGEAGGGLWGGDFSLGEGFFGGGGFDGTVGRCGGGGACCGGGRRGFLFGFFDVESFTLILFMTLSFFFSCFALQSWIDGRRRFGRCQRSIRHRRRWRRRNRLDSLDIRPRNIQIAFTPRNLQTLESPFWHNKGLWGQLDARRTRRRRCRH